MNEADKKDCYYYQTCPHIITCIGCRSYEVVKIKNIPQPSKGAGDEV